MRCARTSGSPAPRSAATWASAAPAPCWWTASASTPASRFLAGATPLVDLRTPEVLRPARVVDVGRLALTRIDSGGGGLRIGALATNTDVAQNGEVKKKLPALSEALLSGASPQLRNAATV